MTCSFYIQQIVFTSAAAEENSKWRLCFGSGADEWMSLFEREWVCVLKLDLTDSNLTKYFSAGERCLSQRSKT